MNTYPLILAFSRWEKGLFVVVCGNLVFSVLKEMLMDSYFRKALMSASVRMKRRVGLVSLSDIIEF